MRRTTADSGIGIRPRPEMRRPMRRRRGTSPGLIAGVAVAALAVVGGAFAFLRMRSPVLESVNPARVTPGQTVTLRGARFSPDAAANVVRIGDRTVRVTRASAGQIEIEVPDLALTPGQETRLPVVVQVAGRPSQPKEVVFYPTPRIHNLLPDVALAGEEIVVQGRGWGSTPRVRFGELDAEILAVMPDAVRVRVPAIEGSPGTSVEVTVIQGTDISNQWTFVLGKLPLIARLDPSPAAPGDTVTISGRGFGPSMSDNLVRINGQHAVLLSANAMELKFVVPYVSAEGSAPVAVHARGRDRFAEASLNLKPPADPIDLHFVVEPLDDVEGHDHVVIATELGPTFVLSAAGGRSATQRALEAATRLNAATVLVKASLEADFEVKDLETAPILAVVGKPDAVLQVTDEDAAAYNEDWTKQGGRGGSVTRGRLARWWGAVARDLVLLLVRSEKPHCAADLAPEGRALQDVFQSARRATNFGTPRTVLAEMKISQKEALRVIGLRVPASVTGPAVSAAPAPSAPQTVLKLDGAWTITETDSRSRQTASITFQGRSGIYSPAAGVTLQLLSVEPGPRNVRFALQFRGFTRYYDGRWDGLKIAGTISSEASGGGGLGRFEMVRER